MSAELEVLPQIPRTICWGEVQEQLGRLSVGDDLRSFFGPSPTLVRTAEGTFEDSSLDLIPESFYSVVTPEKTSLAINIQSNASSSTNEYEILEDNIQNRTTIEMSQIARRWREVGYSIGVESYGRRHTAELKAAIAVAIAFAMLCEGLILVKETFSNVCSGVYAPGELLAYLRAEAGPGAVL